LTRCGRGDGLSIAKLTATRITFHPRAPDSCARRRLAAARRRRAGRRSWWC